jgi:hypothetical protein
MADRLDSFQGENCERRRSASVANKANWLTPKCDALMAKVAAKVQETKYMKVMK